MSLDLAAEREYVRALLEGLAGAQAYAYIPARTSLPAWLVVPADPYLTNGQTFRTARAHFRVAFISQTGANSNESADCDNAISAAVEKFLSEGFAIESGSAPYALAYMNSSYVAQDLSISFSVDL